jgi:lipoprotein-anchoring transpeptidase ErfK/SrfK
LSDVPRSDALRPEADGPPLLPSYLVAVLAVVALVLGFAAGGSLRSALPFLSATVSTAPGEQGDAAGPRTPVDVVPVALTASASPRSSAAPATAPTASTTSSASPTASPAATTTARATAGVPASTAATPVATSASRQGVPLPAASGEGRRIVYQESTMHLWVVGADGVVLRDYPVTGRPGWPKPGSYEVFSKSRSSVSPKYGVTFGYMVRFAKGHSLDIGFHDIPRTMGSGKAIQAESELGAPIGHGGCVRQRTVDAKWLYAWASIGTPVTVLR